jgi:hypothetical protein
MRGFVTAGPVFCWSLSTASVERCEVALMGSLHIVDPVGCSTRRMHRDGDESSTRPAPSITARTSTSRLVHARWRRWRVAGGLRRDSTDDSSSPDLLEAPDYADHDKRRRQGRALRDRHAGRAFHPPGPAAASSQRDGDTLHAAQIARVGDLPASLLCSITWTRPGHRDGPASHHRHQASGRERAQRLALEWSSTTTRQLTCLQRCSPPTVRPRCDVDQNLPVAKAP